MNSRTPLPMRVREIIACCIHCYESFYHSVNYRVVFKHPVVGYKLLAETFTDPTNLQRTVVVYHSPSFTFIMQAHIHPYLLWSCFCVFKYSWEQVTFSRSDGRTTTTQCKKRAAVQNSCVLSRMEHIPQPFQCLTSSEWREQLWRE